MKGDMRESTDFPFEGTRAAQMLAAGLKDVADRDGSSLRAIGKQLGYKQAVVLSHMATGRVPIPVERVPMLAEALGLDQRTFSQAVLEQRYPGVAWNELFRAPSDDNHSAEFGGLLAGVRLQDLSEDHKAVARELVRDAWPRERWLAVPEVPLLSLIRKMRPDGARAGYSSDDLQLIEAALAP